MKGLESKIKKRFFVSDFIKKSYFYFQIKNINH